METLTNPQIIEENGHPAFAVIPWDEFELIRPAYERQKKLRHGIPNAVAKRIALEDVHPVKAWREHLGLEQTDVAKKAKMQQAALARIEAGHGGKTRKTTLNKLAAAMQLTLEQVDLID